MRFASPRTTRALFISAAFAAILISCGKEVTAPVAAFTRYARGLSFLTKFPTAYATSGASNLVPFTRVHVVLLRADGKVAIDTTVDFPAGADELTLSLTVPIAPGAPSSGEPMTASLGYLDAQGQTVFKGEVPVTVSPSLPGTPAPPPVQVPVQYTGTGSDAQAVTINPKSNGGLAGSTLNFTAQVINSNNAVMPGTPVVFSSSAPTVAAVGNPAVGTVTLVARGQAWIRAQTLTGQSDSALVTVTLPASQLLLQSGNDQTGDVGADLDQVVVGKVAASDGIGVGGVTVSFAAANGGKASPASAVSDANGLVRAAWTLGTTPGPQTFAMTAAGLGGSPLGFRATARPRPASQLELASQPSNAAAGASLGSISLRATDAFGNLSTSFSGNVSVTLVGGTAGAALSGTKTVAASGGFVTFSGLSVNRPGTGYALAFSAAGVPTVQSSAFTVVAGAAATFTYTVQPSNVVAGAPIAPAVTLTALDAQGNVATGFTGTVSLALGTNPSSASLGGTVSRAATAGVVQFNDVTVSKQGTGVTLVASATGVANATSAAFNVLSAAPASLTVSSVPSSLGAGATIAPAVTVTALDVLGNRVQSFVGTVTVAFGTNTGGATLRGTSSRAAVAGVATFDDLSVDKLGAGYTLVFTTPDVPAATSGAFSVVAGPAVRLIMTDPSSVVSAGTPIAPPVTVTALDALGNVATSFRDNITMSFSDDSPNGGLTGNIARLAVNGVATFADLSAKYIGTGYRLRATAPGLASATSAAFSVVLGPAKYLNVISGDRQSAAGASVLSPITVQLTDAGGNPISGATVTFAVASGGGSVTPASATTNASGQAVVNWTLGNVKGAQSITATSGAIATTITGTATSTVTGLMAVFGGDNQFAGSGATVLTPPSVVLTSPSRVAMPGVTVTFAASTGSQITGATTSVTDANGVAAVSGWRLGSTGSFTLTATAPGYSSVTFTATVNVVPMSVTAAEKLPNGTQQFSVTGGNYGDTYVWSVNSIVGGNTTYGTITSGGFYTAPATVPTPSTFPVCAQSNQTPANKGCVNVTITQTPTAGGELIVMNDINWGDDTYGLGNSGYTYGLCTGPCAGNVQFVKNLVNFTPTGSRRGATKVLLINDQNYPSMFRKTGGEGWSTMASIIRGEGYTAVDTTLRTDLTNIPSDVKVVMLVMPGISFSIAELNGLKTFASQGGRIIFFGENQWYYSFGMSIENTFLSNMGAVMTNTGACDAPGVIVNSASHQLTAGIAASGTGGFYMNCVSHMTLGPNDFSLMTYGGVVVAAIAKIDLTLLSLPSLRASRAQESANTLLVTPQLLGLPGSTSTGPPPRP